MAGSIGSAALNIGVNASALGKGLSGASKAVSGWAVGITSSVALVGNTFAGFVGAIGIKGLTFSFSELGEQINQAFSDIDNAAKQSSRLGLTVDQLWSLQHAADLSGVSAEEFGKGLEKMQKNIGEGLSGNKKAVDTFAELGLSIEQLRSGDAESNFLRIADALQRIENPAERIRLAMDVFGKAGGKFLNIGGMEAIKAAQEDFQRIHGSIGSTASSDVEAANDAASRAGVAWQGIIRNIAVALAPVKEVISVIVTEGLVLIRQTFSSGPTVDWGKIAIEVFKNVGKALAWLGEQFRNLAATAIGFIIPIVEAMQAIPNGLASAQNGISNSLTNLGEAVGLLPAGTAANEAAFQQMQQSANNGTNSMVAGLRAAQQALTNFTPGEAGNRIDGFFNSIEANMFERRGGWAGIGRNLANSFVGGAAARLIPGMQQVVQQLGGPLNEINDKLRTQREEVEKQIANFGMSPEQLANRDTLNQLRANGGDAVEFSRLREAQERLRVMQEAQQTMQQFANPVTTLQNRMRQLDEQLDGGRITWDVYTQAVNQAMAEAEKATGIGEVKMPTAMLEGSREAVNAIMRHQVQGGPGADDPQTRLLRVQQAQQQIQQQMLNEFRQFNRREQPAEAVLGG